MIVTFALGLSSATCVLLLPVVPDDWMHRVGPAAGRPQYEDSSCTVVDSTVGNGTCLVSATPPNRDPSVHTILNHQAMTAVLS